MIQVSLKNRLQEIDASLAPRQTLKIPHGFHSWPPSGSLRAGAHAMRSPRVDEWVQNHEGIFTNQPWTHRCQGLTSDGEHWFISSNNDDFRGVYKFTLDFVFLDRATFPGNLGNHIGDIDHADGIIYAAIERKPLTPRVALFDTTPSFIGAADLGGELNPKPPQTPDMPWCAIHPWNGYLYSSNYDNVDQVNAYDRHNNFAFVGSLHLQGDTLDGVQGGVISHNGHLYLASHSAEAIYAYSMLNGAFLRRFPIEMHKASPKFEELEGLTLWPILVEGDPSQIHVILLDRDAISGSFDAAVNPDDIFLKHITVPDPGTL